MNHTECIKNLEDLISAEDSDDDVSSTSDHGDLKKLNPVLVKWTNQ